MKFTSSYLAMSFMDRLRLFTEMALNKRKETREKFLHAEMAANEEKLIHTKLISKGEHQRILTAEFMPAPGSVPNIKTKDIWAEQGNYSKFYFKGIHMPWGGRFKSPEKKSRGEVYS
jgi:hypothetical protein